MRSSFLSAASAPLKPVIVPAGLPERAELVAMLAALGDRGPQQVPESIDSMELAWLIHQVEERYGRQIDLDDEAMARLVAQMKAIEGTNGALWRYGQASRLIELARRAGPGGPVQRALDEARALLHQVTARRPGWHRAITALGEVDDLAGNKAGASTNYVRAVQGQKAA